MTTQTTPILEAWNSFTQTVLARHNLPPTVIAFIKDSFFSGAFSCFQACMRAGDAGETPEGEKQIENIGSEMNAFLQEKMQGMILSMLKGEKNEH